VRQINRANFRCVGSGRYIRAHWGRGLDEWRRGCAEFSDSDRVLSPRQCVSLLGHGWKRCGEPFERTAAPAMADVYQMLLNEKGGTKVAESLLRSLLNNHANLLVKDRLLWLSGEFWKGKYKKQAVQETGVVRALLSLLLYKHGVRKESMSTGFAYHVGQLLATADGLQAHYSREVRKTALKNPLGTEMAQLATRSPLTAHNNLMRRMLPYLKWARTADDGLAHWFLKRIGELEEACSGKLESRPMTAVEQAEFWFGLTARNNKQGE